MGLVIMFLQSGGWSEAWFIALVAFHLFSTFVIVTSTHQPTRASIFCLLCAVAQLAENLNAVAAIHWRCVDWTGRGLSVDWCRPAQSWPLALAMHGVHVV